MDTIQHEKNCIQKREQTARVAFSLLMLIIFVIVASVFILLRTTRLGSGWLVLSCGLFCFLLVGLGTSQLGPYLQRTQRRKQQWLNAYGQHIYAVMSNHPEENAFIIGGRVRGRGAAFTRYLHWQDPHTALLYTFCVNTRFSSALRTLPEGTVYPVQFDPADLSFFDVPGK